jgi:hypothetical protein
MQLFDFLSEFRDTGSDEDKSGSRIHRSGSCVPVMNADPRFAELRKNNGDF